MARRKQKGANFGKRQGSQSQQVQKSRGRNQIILYSAFGLAGLFLLCGLIWFIFRPTGTTTVADDENNGVVAEADTTADDSDTSASANEGSADEDAGNTETESGFYADGEIVTDENGELVSGSDDTDTADSGFTAGELGEPIGGERPMAVIDPAERNGFYAEYPETVIDTSLTYEAVFVTEKGDMRVLLFDDEAPITVNNFVYLAQEGYYDGTTFHRVIDNFMAQGGDPSGTGSGGPGYNFEDEVDNGFAFDRRGLLAMANAGPGTNGSQFFITFVPTPHLNGNHTIFGELLEGDDVLSAVTVRNPGAAELGDTINSVEIYVSEG